MAKKQAKKAAKKKATKVASKSSSELKRKLKMEQQRVAILKMQNSKMRQTLEFIAMADEVATLDHARTAAQNAITAIRQWFKSDGEIKNLTDEDSLK